jgi:adenine-specific DNA methylase
MAEIEQANDDLQYSRIPTVTRYVVPQKQAVKRHYGSHQYFTKRAWNVIQTYIENFTKPGDVVCDPFGGSGVTIVEALVLGRKGIYVDVSAWAGFLASEVAIAPVDLSKLSEGYELVEKACASKINDWWSLTDKKAEQIKLRRWYPKNQILPRNADVKFVHELFTHKQLLALSELLYQIGKIDDEKIRNLLRYTFSATLYMCNRTFISAKDRKESRGGSSIFSIYRYKVAKRSVNLNPWEVLRPIS